MGKITVDEYANRVFARVETVIPKYFIDGVHVYPYTQNVYGQTCKDLAAALGLDSLADYFDNELKPTAAKRRLMLGLTDDLLREMVEFL